MITYYKVYYATSKGDAYCDSAPTYDSSVSVAISRTFAFFAVIIVQQQQPSPSRHEAERRRALLLYPHSRICSLGARHLSVRLLY